MRPLLISAISLATVLSATADSAIAQEDWKAPSDAAAEKNPVAASTESIRLGRLALGKTCASCHGVTGAGDGFAASMLKRKPKDLAAVLAGDLIVEIAGEFVSGLEDYMDVLATLRIGSNVSVKVERAGKLKQLTVEVGERDG